MEDAKSVVVRVLTNGLTAPSNDWRLTARDLRWAKVLLGQYRKADIDDPEVYLQSWARIFSAYSDDIVRVVADPLGGIASRVNWVVTVKEVYQACNDEAARVAEKRRRDEGIRQQLEERDREDRERAQRPAAAQAEGQQLGPADVDWSYAAPRSSMRAAINGRDGQHMRRIADDLAARRARNALREEAVPPPPPAAEKE